MSVRSRLRPLAETLGVMLAVTTVGAAVGPARVALSTAVLSAPWTLVTSVYAHASVVHLLSNAVVVALAGTPVALVTTRLRFHAFFLATGALAGLAAVLLGASAVVGASGAAFALVGYVLAANPVAGLAGRIFGGSSWLVVGVVTVVALGLALVFSAPGSTLVGHAAGAALGLLAGLNGLLATGGEPGTER